jgi:hypothetical protein
MSSVRTYLIRLGGVALASGALLGTVVTAAGAATTPGSAGTSGSNAVPTTLAGIKAKAATDITDRVNALNAAIAKVNGANGLGSDQATLVSYLGTDGAPLQQLNQKIQGDPTVQEAAADFKTIFTNFRVYALVLPASRIAADADRISTTAIPALTSDATKARAHVNPTNQAELQLLIADLDSQIGTATNATNGLAGTVLALTPAQWNANNGLLGPSKSSDQAAVAAVQKGRSDVRQIVEETTTS